MGRHGMNEECDFGSREEQWAYICFRGAVNSAVQGKRGQAFLRELIAALDALPEKKLIEDELEQEGQYCALGAVGKARGLDMSNLDTYNTKKLSEVFGIAECMVREIEFINDETVYAPVLEADAKRWEVVRQWAESELKDSAQLP